MWGSLIEFAGEMGMQPLYDHRGDVVGWLDGSELLDLKGVYRAFLSGPNIHSCRDGRHVGWLDDGWVRDVAMRDRWPSSANPTEVRPSRREPRKWARHSSFSPPSTR